MSDAGSERLTEHVSSVARDRSWPNQVPRNAATLIVLDRTEAAPKVLMGRRHPGHKFMPGKFVFPGGRLEPDDRRMPSTGTLHDRSEAALAARVVRPTASLGRALALAAIRETYEETGLMLGRKVDGMPRGPEAGAWSAFFAEGVLPDLEPIRFVGRAITPPGRPKRFDTRFFAVDRDAVTAEHPDFAGPDKELVELAWVGLPDALGLDLPAITVVMLEELGRRIADGFDGETPVPFYYERRKRFHRELL